MKFRNAKEEAQRTIELVCLILSLSAIFFQIWILSTSWEAHFQEHDNRLPAYVFFSFIAFLVCALSAWTTTIDIMKGAGEGRTKTYQKQTQFRHNST